MTHIHWVTWVGIIVNLRTGLVVTPEARGLVRHARSHWRKPYSMFIIIRGKRELKRIHIIYSIQVISFFVSFFSF